MDYLSERKYSFTSSALPKDTFAVVAFTGEEGLSQSYMFDILLVTENAEVDLEAVVHNGARFTIHRDQGDDVIYSGILTAFEQQNAYDKVVFYRAVLVPRLWWLTLTHHNQVFLDKTVKEIVSDVLKDGGLTTLNFDFRLKSEYPPVPYVCQYGESHAHFVSRWLAREGIYYYFEQHSDGEKLIFTDTTIAHTQSRYGETLHFSPPSGLGEAHRTESVQGFLCRWHILPNRILLKDYNYEKPSLDIIGAAVVDEKGKGEIYNYGVHFKTPEEGNRLAGILAQELRCHQEEYVGESTAPYLQPGFVFKLEDHYRKSFNKKYLTVSIKHHGSQAGYLTAGIRKGLAEREARVYYRNEFTAIPATVQFRAKWVSDPPKITGTLSAKIDAAGSGKYAELDDQGRYKVILPFDRSGRKDGKASTWLRMVQPYAGMGHGMHFPLHKGTEVLLSFIEGNPDRPIISGSAPNPETPSPVTGTDQTMAKITTAGGNKIHMEDKEGHQRILLHTPTAGTFLRLGSHNDPDDPGKDDDDDGGEWGAKLVSEKGIAISAGGKNEIILGESMETVVGSAIDINLINKTELVAAICLGLELAVKGTYGPEEWTLKGSHERAAATKEEAVGESIKAHGQSLKTALQDIRSHGQKIQANTDKIDANAQAISTNGEAIRANGQKISTNAQAIKAHGESIKAHGQSIKAHGTTINAHGTMMRSVGAQMVNAGTKMAQSGTRVSQAGLHIINAGVNMRDAALISDG